MTTPDASLDARLARVVLSEATARDARAAPPPASPGTASSTHAFLLASLTAVYEEELGRLASSGADASSGKTGLSSPASPSRTPKGGRAWRSHSGHLAAAPAEPEAEGKEGQSDPKTPSVVHCSWYPMPEPEDSNTTHVVPYTGPADGQKESQLVPSASPDVTTLSFVERRAYACDAAAFAHRLASDTLLFETVRFGVRYAAAGCVRFGAVPAAKAAALRHLATLVAPGHGTRTDECCVEALGCGVLPLACGVVQAGASDEGLSFDPACSILTSLLRHGPPPADAQQLLNACVAPLLSALCGRSNDGVPKPCEAPLRLLGALLAPTRESEQGFVAQSCSTLAFDEFSTERMAAALAADLAPTLAALLSRPDVAGSDAAAEALAALSYVALSPKRSDILSHSAGLETLAAAAAAAAAPPHRLTPACALLGAAALRGACDGDVSYAKRVVSHAASLSALGSASGDHPGVARDVCVSIRRCADLGDEAKSALATAGCVNTCVTALRSHVGADATASAAARALASLVTAAPASTVAGACGGLEACVDAINASSSRPEVLDPASSALYTLTFSSGSVLHSLERVSAYPGGQQALMVALGSVAVGPSARDKCISALALLQSTSEALKRSEDA